MTDIISDFRFQYRWLSNFHVAEIVYEDLSYPSTEHAYQAAKTLDHAERLRFAALPTPRDAKREGRKIAIRPDWEEVKRKVMFDVCMYKFSEHADLKKLLADTGEAILIEGNTWNDTYWGVCNGVGENHLGRILEVIRLIHELEDWVDSL